MGQETPRLPIVETICNSNFLLSVLKDCNFILTWSYNFFLLYELRCLHRALKIRQGQYFRPVYVPALFVQFYLQIKYDVFVSSFISSTELAVRKFYVIFLYCFLQGIVEAGFFFKYLAKNRKLLLFSKETLLACTYSLQCMTRPVTELPSHVPELVKR